MKKILLVITILSGLLAFSAVHKQALSIVDSEIIIQRQSYALAYDGQHRQARWVYQCLTENNLKGSIDRRNFDFVEDPDIPIHLRANKKDYRGSSYDHGHLCPAADSRSTNLAMKETFYLSNTTPQQPQLNRVHWLKLEKRMRYLARKSKTLHVITGPLYLSHIEDDGKKYVKYEVIGENDVAVPTHYFKIALDEKRMPVEAYILPNVPIPVTTSLEKFKTTLEKIERAAGIVFNR